MSEVKRWYIGAYGGEAQARTVLHAEPEIIREGQGEYFVLHKDFARVTAERDALQLLLNERDEQVHSLEQRRHAEQQACQAAERRVGELKLLLTEAIKAWELIQYGDPPVKLAKVMARARAALNPTAEAESQSTGPGYAPRSQSFQTN
ncbi:hypothetical protein EGM97_09415 [Pseudomonas sp. AF32]|uniref:hypothetical protein n=1 Tax=Pseudomonas sp. AF32 TaxID=554390 RepID=UPI001EED8D85|nr:hypothetical protein [Pseudomonas sp. AF32]MCG6574922.1 hypothetical protein [Pseudomonas sp. AF32]